MKSTVGLFADNAVIYLAITDDQLYPVITRSFKPRNWELGIRIFLISVPDPSSILYSFARRSAGRGSPLASLLASHSRKKGDRVESGPKKKQYGDQPSFAKTKGISICV